MMENGLWKMGKMVTTGRTGRRISHFFIFHHPFFIQEKAPGLPLIPHDRCFARTRRRSSQENGMKRSGWLILGLALAFLSGESTRGAEKPQAFGDGPAYESLAKLPVMHTGRKKPLDTLAREEIKQIFGRETIKLYKR